MDATTSLRDGHWCPRQHAPHQLREETILDVVPGITAATLSSEPR